VLFDLERVRLDTGAKERLSKLTAGISPDRSGDYRIEIEGHADFI